MQEMLTRFPKAFTIGDRHISSIFSEEVEITEKIDGSQFSFGKINNELCARSKGKQIVMDAPEKLFSEGVEYVKSIADKITDDSQFYTEYLKKPKHNTLAYQRIPKNHLALFGMKLFDKYITDWEVLKEWADRLDIDIVPCLFTGKINTPDEVKHFLEVDSYLGNEKIEGIFVKNYHREMEIGGHWHRLMCGKFVSEEFKEKHIKGWKQTNTTKGNWQLFCEGYRTEARWRKAIQALRDNGELTDSPKDIGNLIKTVKLDIINEEKENIKDFLWDTFKEDLLRKSIAGLPQFYKNYLLEEGTTYE